MVGLEKSWSGQLPQQWQECRARKQRYVLFLRYVMRAFRGKVKHNGVMDCVLILDDDWSH